MVYHTTTKSCPNCDHRIVLSQIGRAWWEEDEKVIRSDFVVNMIHDEFLTMEGDRVLLTREGLSWLDYPAKETGCRRY